MQALEVIRPDDSPGGRFAAALVDLYEGRPRQARSLAWEMIQWVRRQEPVLHPGLDVFEWQQVVAPVFGITREELEARP